MASERLQNCIRFFRARCPHVKGSLRIASVNNFPTGAGLASSASGFACLGLPPILLRRVGLNDACHSSDATRCSVRAEQTLRLR